MALHGGEKRVSYSGDHVDRNPFYVVALEVSHVQRHLQNALHSVPCHLHNAPHQLHSTLHQNLGVAKM